MPLISILDLANPQPGFEAMTNPAYLRSFGGPGVSPSVRTYLPFLLSLCSPSTFPRLPPRLLTLLSPPLLALLIFLLPTSFGVDTI